MTGTGDRRIHGRSERGGETVEHDGVRADARPRGASARPAPSGGPGEVRDRTEPDLRAVGGSRPCHLAVVAIAAGLPVRVAQRHEGQTEGRLPLRLR